MAEKKLEKKETKALNRELLQFIEKSPSAFHAVANLTEMAQEAGYQRLEERDAWELSCGKKYMITRNGSSLALLQMPASAPAAWRGFHVVAAHSDSPTYKIKENPEVQSEGIYIRLNTEKYGGMLPAAWLDRPLSVAGRLAVCENGKVVSRLVNVDKDMLVIPNLAIHMNRDAAKAMEYQPQVDMLPLYGDSAEGGAFLQEVAEAAGVNAEDILGHDLFLYVREKGRMVGRDGTFLLSPKLDDLQCAYLAARAMLMSTPDEYANLCVIFDNEEVGSSSRQGADSTFCSDILARIREHFALGEGGMQQKIAESLLISADNAHAVHPNHPEKSDPTNRPYLNRGIVIKYHGGQKYTTDACTAAELKLLCKEADVPFQTFANRSDQIGGSTLGNISTAHVSFPSVDIGLPQLAMHSAVETAGAEDSAYLLKLLRTFYGK